VPGVACEYPGSQSCDWHMLVLLYYW